MADECDTCSFETALKRAEAKERFLASIQRIKSRIDPRVRDALVRVRYADGVAGLEEIPMLIISFPAGSILQGFHFGITIKHLLNSSNEEIDSGLIEDIELQLPDPPQQLSWWRRIFGNET